MKRHWFKPKRFWGFWAAYYPASWEGWAVAAIAIVLLVRVFAGIDSRSHSVSDTLIGFAPFLLAVLIGVDILTHMFGEFPSWWREGFPAKMKKLRIIKFVVIGLLFVYFLAQALALPIRLESCENMRRAAELTRDPDKERIRDVMCSPLKFLGVTDTLMNLRLLTK